MLGRRCIERSHFGLERKGWDVRFRLQFIRIKFGLLLWSPLDFELLLFELLSRLDYQMIYQYI